MIYLLYGEDDYLKNQFLKKIKRNFGEVELGINYIQINESNVQSVISDIGSITGYVIDIANN